MSFRKDSPDNLSRYIYLSLQENYFSVFFFWAEDACLMVNEIHRVARRLKKDRKERGNAGTRYNFFRYERKVSQNYYRDVNLLSGYLHILSKNFMIFRRKTCRKNFMTSVSQVRSLSLSSLKRLFRNAIRGRVDICCLYRAYKQIQAHYSCMRPKCTKFSHGTGGHVGDTRAPARRCVLCLFLAEMCHMSLAPPFLVKSNGDTEVGKPGTSAICQ